MKRKIIISIFALLSIFLVTGCGCKKKDEEAKTNYLVLVNKESKLPEDWEKTIELVDITNSIDETYKVEKKTAAAYEKLREELLQEGIDIELDSTYRTVKEQQEIWDSFEKEYGIDYTKKYVAVPGTSEHHTGLAIDIKLIKDGKIIADNDKMTAEKEIFDQIHAKLSKYGFILRYPVGKEDITGYGSEVWHFRYVDNSEIAKKIMDNNLTLEEYLKNK